MSSIANLLKSTAVAGAVALGLSFTATSASAMNAGEFKAACDKVAGGSSSTFCVSNKNGTRGKIFTPDGTTDVACNNTTCVTQPERQGGGGGSPARTAPKNKGLGVAALLGTAGDRVAPTTNPTKKLDAGQRLPGQVKVDTPKAIKVETPKVSTPAANLGVKNTTVNAIR
jgi:hypothetical protein